MLKLFNIRYLQGRNLHSEIIDNGILARSRHSKERLVDILRSIPLAKPSNVYERGRYLKIHPSSEEEYLKIRETLSNHDVKVRYSYIDSKTDGLVIRDRIITNFVPDGYQPLKSITNPKLYELTNVPESDENRLLFLNGYLIYHIADGSKYVKRVFFIMKMSPNIIQIRHIEGLDRPFLDKVFDGIHFHKISPPLTPKGVWKLYVANRDDYLLLLSRPGSKRLEMSPHYECSLRLPMYLIYFKSEQKISPSQIYLFSLSDKLANSEQIVEAIPELSDVHITKCKYENGNLFIFHIRDRSKFLKTEPPIIQLHMATISRIFFSHSINNISSNILINSYNHNLSPVDNENKSDKDEICTVRGIMFNPKNLKTFRHMINKGVNGIVFVNLDNGHHFYPNEIQDHIIPEQEIHNIFTGIPIESTYQTNDNKWLVSFSADNFEAARFRLFPGQSISLITT
ncbi:hypothetical protein RF11_05020 [Thelohanellus kitauei]|uniref:Uncharacterized protein n=1 Tax=Thelohanellus kitauei TaxID=669202 RepID=A0A0C2M4B2_THEKT|nr:hypothetical protein RF11_05020 [Thelohanellus kitauei]